MNKATNGRALFAGEEEVAALRTTGIVLTNQRVILAPVVSAAATSILNDNATDASMTLESVRFCSVSTDYPWKILVRWLLIALGLLLLGEVFDLGDPLIVLSGLVGVGAIIVFRIMSRTELFVGASSSCGIRKTIPRWVTRSDVITFIDEIEQQKLRFTGSTSVVNRELESRTVSEQQAVG